MSFLHKTMREPPEGVKINDKLSQEEIESTFNTGDVLLDESLATRRCWPLP